MSYWTYINGTIKVNPMGRTQAEKRYILDTVLNHLPQVTGSEDDMHIYVVQPQGCASSKSCDEYGMRTNNLIDRYGRKDRNRGWLRVQETYILVLEGHLRDRMFNETYRELQKWLCRLAKRIDIDDVLIQVKGYNKSEIITNKSICNSKLYETTYGQMFEMPSWCHDDEEFPEPNWCEHLMWDRAKDSDMPVMLAYKYYQDNDNDQEAERRIHYQRS